MVSCKHNPICPQPPASPSFQQLLSGLEKQIQLVKFEDHSRLPSSNRLPLVMDPIRIVKLTEISALVAQRPQIVSKDEVPRFLSFAGAEVLAVVEIQVKANRVLWMARRQPDNQQP